MTDTWGDWFEAVLGEEAYNDLIDDLEALAALAEEIQETPIEAREAKFSGTIDDAIETAEDVYETFAEVLDKSPTYPGGRW